MSHYYRSNSLRCCDIEVLRHTSSVPIEAIQKVLPHLKERAFNLRVEADGIIKSFGLEWNSGNDQFQFYVHMEANSKRKIFSAISKFFDSLSLQY